MCVAGAAYVWPGALCYRNKLESDVHRVLPPQDHTGHAHQSGCAHVYVSARYVFERARVVLVAQIKKMIKINGLP